jgi:hypothetical protein
VVEAEVTAAAAESPGYAAEAATMSTAEAAAMSAAEAAATTAMSAATAFGLRITHHKATSQDGRDQSH